MAKNKMLRNRALRPKSISLSGIKDRNIGTLNKRVSVGTIPIIPEGKLRKESWIDEESSSEAFEFIVEPRLGNTMFGDELLKVSRAKNIGAVTTPNQISSHVSYDSFRSFELVVSDSDSSYLSEKSEIALDILAHWDYKKVEKKYNSQDDSQLGAILNNSPTPATSLRAHDDNIIPNPHHRRLTETFSEASIILPKPGHKSRPTIDGKILAGKLQPRYNLSRSSRGSDFCDEFVFLEESEDKSEFL